MDLTIKKYELFSYLRISIGRTLEAFERGGPKLGDAS